MRTWREYFHDGNRLAQSVWIPPKSSCAFFLPVCSRSPSSALLPFSPTQIENRKKGTLILASLLEDLVLLTSPHSFSFLLEDGWYGSHMPGGQRERPAGASLEQPAKGGLSIKHVDTFCCPLWQPFAVCVHVCQLILGCRHVALEPYCSSHPPARFAFCLTFASEKS